MPLQELRGHVLWLFHGQHLPRHCGMCRAPLAPLRLHLFANLLFWRRTRNSKAFWNSGSPAMNGGFDVAGGNCFKSIATSMCTRPKESSSGCWSPTLRGDAAPTLDSWSRNRNQVSSSIIDASSIMSTAIAAIRWKPASPSLVGSILLPPSADKPKR